jgi:hypothetical protein
LTAYHPFYAAYFCAGLFAVMLVASEVGFWLGRRTELPEKALSELGVLQGSLLGTVALLLGFTFALASGRYDTRRILLAQETNAIGTTYLRTTFLPDDAGREVRRMLRDYLGRRIELLRAGADAEQEKIAAQRVDDLQIALWRRVRTAVVQDPHNELTARLVESLNETIDLEGLQRAARAARVPPSVLLLVIVATLLTAGALGYGFGTARKRVIVGTLAFSALVSSIVFTILDFDRPDRGLIRVSEGMLVTLHERIVRAVDREVQGP